MRFHSLSVFTLMVPHILCQKVPHLPDMICDKCCRSRYSLYLSKSVKLHRADKVQRHLTNLIRSVPWQQAKKYHHNDFYRNEDSIPSEKMILLYAFPKILRNKCS